MLILNFLPTVSGQTIPHPKPTNPRTTQRPAGPTIPIPTRQEEQDVSEKTKRTLPRNQVKTKEAKPKHQTQKNPNSSQHLQNLASPRAKPVLPKPSPKPRQKPKAKLKRPVENTQRTSRNNWMK